MENLIATVTSNCGPIEGFNIFLETRGFLPNSNVHWDLMNEETILPVFPDILKQIGQEGSMNLLLLTTFHLENI